MSDPEDSRGARLPGDLLRPEAYGAVTSQAAPAPVLRTTHASWVFLTAHDAWKVKRPVNFGFLDFRTPAARRQACEDEVRLNRRLAPEVYLGVEPIHDTPAGLALAGDGPVVDWAVHMRRLPDQASASARLARGLLDARALESVAVRLAFFLRDARATPAFGTPEALRRNLDENFDQVAVFVGDLLDRLTFDDVRSFQLGRLAADQDRFAARVAAQRIREGHGDLRLEHLYFLPDPGGSAHPVIIDCIEFNERFRCADVAAEVAFLAMELEAAARPDLAAGFLARFAEASDDYDLYGVLDFYLSYRAWVRAKVAAFVATDESATGEVRARKRDEAQLHFGLARAVAGRPLVPPLLLAVGGVIGSGKSTLAAGLGRALAAPVVRSDQTRKHLAGVDLVARAPAGAYDRAARDRVYEEILRHARVVAGAGRDVILDATFSTRRWRQAAADVARACAARFVFVEARCPADEVRRRLAARRGSPSVSDATDETLDAFLREYEPIGERDPGPHLAVDTAGDPEAAIREAMRGIAG